MAGSPVTGVPMGPPTLGNFLINSQLTKFASKLDKEGCHEIEDLRQVGMNQALYQDCNHTLLNTPNIDPPPPKLKFD